MNEWEFITSTNEETDEFLNRFVESPTKIIN